MFYNKHFIRNILLKLLTFITWYISRRVYNNNNNTITVMEQVSKYLCFFDNTISCG